MRISMRLCRSISEKICVIWYSAKLNVFIGSDSLKDVSFKRLQPKIYQNNILLLKESELKQYEKLVSARESLNSYS